MAELDAYLWKDAQKRWESDADLSHGAIAKELGVSRPAVSSYAKRNGWKRGVTSDVTSVTSDVTTPNEIHAESTVDGVTSIETKAETKEGRGGVRENSGRPSSAQTILNQTIKERAAIHGDSAIETMVELMNNDEIPANVRLAAAEKLLDRGFGKPKQEVEMTGEVSYVDKTDLDDRYAKNMSKTAELAIKTQERIELLKQGVLH